MNIQQHQAQAAIFLAEPKPAPRLKPTEKVYHNGRLMVVLSVSGHQRHEHFPGEYTWVPVYVLAPATRAGSARKGARTTSQPENKIIKDWRP